MGLDQWAYAVPVKLTRADAMVDILKNATQSVPDRALEIQRWRKHPNLHGWMFGLWQARGEEGDEFDFNADTNLRLTLDDLDALERAVKENALPFTEGFFFGESVPEHDAETLAFIAKAREFLVTGKYAVLYTSWW